MNRYATQENFENLLRACGVNAKEQPHDKPYEGITNGEKLMEVFPNIELKDEMPESEFITFTFDHVVCNAVERRWWNAPYERGDEK